MAGFCRGCFRSLGAFYGSDLCPRCEERAEWEAEQDERDGPPDSDRIPYGALQGDLSPRELK